MKNLFDNKSLTVDGKWYLDNLSQRLCNHGNRGSYTIQYSKKIFFDWFSKIEKLDETFVNEDCMYEYIFEDKPDIFQSFILFLIKNLKNLKNLIKKICKII